MASELKARSIKISDEMWDRWKALAGDAGVTALISKSVDGYPALEARISSLETELRIWKNLAGGARKPDPLHPDAVTATGARPSRGLPVRLTQEPLDPKTRHQSGPVLASAVPAVQGEVAWSAPKGRK